MAKEAASQVRIDAELREKVEALYRDMGTSSTGAVCIFTKQSIWENRTSSAVTANRKGTYGRLPKYADMKLAAKEEGTYERAMIGKHKKTD